MRVFRKRLSVCVYASFFGFEGGMAFLLYKFLIIAFPFTLGLAVLFILLLLLFLLLSFLYYLHIKYKLKDADMFSFFCCFARH